MRNFFENVFALVLFFGALFTGFIILDQTVFKKIVEEQRNCSKVTVESLEAMSCERLGCTYVYKVSGGRRQSEGRAYSNGDLICAH